MCSCLILNVDFLFFFFRSQKRKSEDLNGDSTNGQNEDKKEEDNTEEVECFVDSYYILWVKCLKFKSLIRIPNVFRNGKKNALKWSQMNCRLCMKNMYTYKYLSSPHSILTFWCFSSCSTSAEEIKPEIKPVAPAKVTILCSVIWIFPLDCWMLETYWCGFCLKTPPPKCQDCRQYLDDSDLKFFQGDPDNAVS